MSDKPLQPHFRCTHGRDGRWHLWWIRPGVRHGETTERRYVGSYPTIRKAAKAMHKYHGGPCGDAYYYVADETGKQLA
jgi:hypothetical protein